MAVRGRTRGFCRTAAVRGNTSGPGQLQERRIKFGLYDGKWCATDLLVASADTLEDVLKGLEVYEVMDTRGLTV
jgi:hypothetical protein